MYCGRQILANNKDMVAREGLEPPPPAFSRAALWGENWRLHSCCVRGYCRSNSIGSRSNYKAAVALQCPVRNGRERQGTGFGCTVLVPRVLNQRFLPRPNKRGDRRFCGECNRANHLFARSATTTRSAAYGFPSFPQDERNNHKGSNRVGPSEVPNRVDSKANQSDQGKIGTQG